MLQIQVVIGICSLFFFVITFELIRKRHLREEYSLLWLVTSLIIAVLSLWPGLIPVFTKITGLYYLSAIVGIIFVFLILVLMHYSVVISRLKEGNKELVQRYALLEFRLRELEKENGKRQS